MNRKRNLYKLHEHCCGVSLMVNFPNSTLTCSSTPSPSLFISSPRGFWPVTLKQLCCVIWKVFQRKYLYKQTSQLSSLINTGNCSGFKGADSDLGEGLYLFVLVVVILVLRPGRKLRTSGMGELRSNHSGLPEINK